MTYLSCYLYSVIKLDIRNKIELNHAASTQQDGPIVEEVEDADEQ